MIEWWVALAGPTLGITALGLGAVHAYGQLKERVSANDRLQAERYKSLEVAMTKGFENLNARLTEKVEASDGRIDRLERIVNGRFGSPNPM